MFEQQRDGVEVVHMLRRLPDQPNLEEFGRYTIRAHRLAIRHNSQGFRNFTWV